MSHLDMIVANDNGQVSQSLMVENRCVMKIKMTAYLDQIERRIAESKEHLEQVRERHP